uniref:Fork-head domain-containing protein n=1 Tax=Anopheles funestus TaxID=62324 RepID=A0A182RZ37_ANOFN
MLNVCADLVQFDQYSLQLYNYAMVERFRSNQFFNYGNFVADTRTLSRFFKPSLPPNPVDAATAAAAAAAAAAAGSALLADASKLSSQAPKPQYSYIGLIAIAILSSPEKKLVLSDIYQHILDNYSYFRSRGPGWRNSIRHNLSLNDCFIKAGRSAHGKGHYWAVHPANVEDFLKGDFRRRKAQRKVRRHMGLTSDDDIYDNSSPRQFFPAINSPPQPPSQQGPPTQQPSAGSVLPPHPVLANPALYLGPDDGADEREPYELRRPRLCSPASSSQSPSPLPPYTAQALVLSGPKTSPIPMQPSGGKTPQQ